MISSEARGVDCAARCASLWVTAYRELHRTVYSSVYEVRLLPSPPSAATAVARGTSLVARVHELFQQTELDEAKSPCSFGNAADEFPQMFLPASDAPDVFEICCVAAASDSDDKENKPQRGSYHAAMVIKVFNETVSAAQLVNASVVREIEVYRLMSRRAFAPSLLGVGLTARKNLFAVMERWTNLREWAEAQRVGPRAAAAATHALLCALAELHRNDYVHNDVKLDNLYIGNSASDVRLADFGLTACVARVPPPPAPPGRATMKSLDNVYELRPFRQHKHADIAASAVVLMQLLAQNAAPAARCAAAVCREVVQGGPKASSRVRVLCTAFVRSVAPDRRSVDFAEFLVQCFCPPPGYWNDVSKYVADTRQWKL